jgi:hypothetical protein
MTDREAIQKLVTELERKLFLAKTSLAYARGTNAANIRKREAQIRALRRVLGTPVA